MRLSIILACFAPGSHNISESVRDFFELREQFNNCVKGAAKTDEDLTSCHTCEREYYKLVYRFPHLRSLRKAKANHQCRDLVVAVSYLQRCNFC